MPNDNHYESDSGITLETRFVEHFMFALDRLQSCWINETHTFLQKPFNLQLLYLIRILPDKSKQAGILRQWNDTILEAKELMPSLGTEEHQAYAGMEIVTELMLFVCNNFDLLNVDITGPATSKQWQKAVIEVPDMTLAPPEIT
jgi:hypothetical protein